MHATVRSVNLDVPAANCPKLASFENGYLNNDEKVAKRMKFDLYKPKFVEDPSGVKNLLRAESSNMKYIGKRTNRSCKYYLGVLNSDSEEIDIYNAETFSLHPSIIDDNNKVVDENADKKAEPTYMEKNDKLIEAFGSARQKRAVSARKKNLVDKVELNCKIRQVADKYELADLAVTQSEAQKDSITPPINLKASTPALLYDITHLISAEDEGVLVGEVSEFLDAKHDVIQKWRAEKAYPEYILSHLSTLPVSVDARLQKAIKLLYLHYLIRFFKLTFTELRKRDVLSDVPEEIRRKLFSEFSLEKDKKRLIPKRLKDKALCYILVLSLILDEFILDCALLMKDLKLGPGRISNHLRAIGCTVETKKQKRTSKDSETVNTTSVTIASLKVPLPANFSTASPI